MKKILFFIITILLSGAPLLTVGSAVDTRRRIPSVFQNSWIYLSIGGAKTFFSPSDIAQGYEFDDQKETITALRLSIGHYFNPYWGLSLSLMRGAHSNKFIGVQSIYPLSAAAATTEYSVTNNLFTIAIRPTLPLKYGLSIYGEGGLGFISRKGFQINDRTVVSDASVVTAMIGAGLYKEWPCGILLGIDMEYTPPMQNQKQPAIYYVGLGLGYITRADYHGLPHSQTSYDFPLNVLQANYIHSTIFYADVARYFSPPYLPIFFDGRIKIAEGFQMMYERNFFHTNKNFSMEWGVSAAQWQSRMLGQNFYTLSLFPELKVWIIRLPTVDFYFTYSLAGPAYISRVYIDNINSGSHFTFQDFLGFGAFLGSQKRIQVNLKIVHFSNGNTLPENPGVDVPVMFGLGFSW